MGLKLPWSSFLDHLLVFSIYCPILPALTRGKLLLGMIKLLRHTYNKNYLKIIYQQIKTQMTREIHILTSEKKPVTKKVFSYSHYKYILMFLFQQMHSDAYIYLLLYEYKIEFIFKHGSTIGQNASSLKFILNK